MSQILEDELANDPLIRGYAGMTDQQLVDSLNAPDRTRDREAMSSGEIMESIDGVEFIALSNAKQARVDRVLGLGAEIIVGPGNTHNAVQELLDAFGGGSLTIASLVALRTVAISRAEEIGFGPVSLGTLKLESIR